MADDPTLPPRRLQLSRRGFLASSLGVALTACGDDPLGASADALNGADGLDAWDTSDDGPDLADIAETAETTDTGDIAEAADSADLTDLDEATDITGPADTSPDTAPPAPLYDPAAHPEASASLFPIGVWSSDPTSDDSGALAITLATRYLGDPDEPVELFVLARDPSDGDRYERDIGPLVLRRPVTVAGGGFIAFDLRSDDPDLLSPLAPHAEHAFLFVAAERRSPIGRFTSPPAATARPVVQLGAASCASHTFRPFQVLERASESALDAFILLGDTTYADDARTLDEYRANWQRNLQLAGYAKLRKKTPTVATWDDHEVDNNWNPETFDATRLAAARQCFFEHTNPRAPSPRIWRSLRFGETVEVFVLDCRGERRPSTRTSNDPIYISHEQEDWLVEAVTSSPCVFKVIANTVPITTWPPLYLSANDRWQGYGAQRSSVLAALSEVPGLLWVAGDFHFGAVAQVDPPEGPFHAQTEILVGPVAHLNPALSIVELTGSRDQFRWLSGERNYGRLICDPTTSPPRLTIEHVGPGGTVLNRHVLLG